MLFRKFGSCVVVKLQWPLLVSPEVNFFKQTSVRKYEKMNKLTRIASVLLLMRCTCLISLSAANPVTQEQPSREQT